MLTFRLGGGGGADEREDEFGMGGMTPGIDFVTQFWMISHNNRASKCQHCQDWTLCFIRVCVFVCFVHLCAPTVVYLGVISDISKTKLTLKVNVRLFCMALCCPGLLIECFRLLQKEYSKSCSEAVIVGYFSDPSQQQNLLRNYLPSMKSGHKDNNLWVCVCAWNVFIWAYQLQSLIHGASAFCLVTVRDRCLSYTDLEL